MFERGCSVTASCAEEIHDVDVSYLRRVCDGREERKKKKSGREKKRPTRWTAFLIGSLSPHHQAVVGEVLDTRVNRRLQDAVETVNLNLVVLALVLDGNHARLNRNASAGSALGGARDANATERASLEEEKST